MLGASRPGQASTVAGSQSGSLAARLALCAAWRCNNVAVVCVVIEELSRMTPVPVKYSLLGGLNACAEEGQCCRASRERVEGERVASVP